MRSNDAQSQWARTSLSTLRRRAKVWKISNVPVSAELFWGVGGGGVRSPVHFFYVWGGLIALRYRLNLNNNASFTLLKT